MTSKYFTNFGFRGYLLTDFHCSHLYLGEIGDLEIEQLKEKILSFHSENTIRCFQICFNNFKKLNGRNVLSADIKQFPPELRALFQLYQSEFNFHPHVTIDERKINSFDGIVDRYVLLKKAGKNITEILNVPFKK